MGNYLYHNKTNPDIFSGLPKVLVKFGFLCRFSLVSGNHYMENAYSLLWAQVKITPGSYSTPLFPLYMSKLNLPSFLQKLFLLLNFLFVMRHRRETQSHHGIPHNFFSLPLLLPSITWESSRTIDFFFLLVLTYACLHIYFFSKCWINMRNNVSVGEMLWSRRIKATEMTVDNTACSEC